MTRKQKRNIRSQPTGQEPTECQDAVGAQSSERVTSKCADLRTGLRPRQNFLNIEGTRDCLRHRRPAVLGRGVGSQREHSVSTEP